MGQMINKYINKLINNNKKVKVPYKTMLINSRYSDLVFLVLFPDKSFSEGWH